MPSAERNGLVKLHIALEETRWSILESLSSSPKTVATIAAEFGITQQHVNFHVTKLEKAGLIRAKRIDPPGGGMKVREYHLVPHEWAVKVTLEGAFVSAKEEVSGSASFKTEVLAAFPAGTPRPSDPSELAALATDFRALQTLAKALGINARQKVPVLLREITEKLSASSEGFTVAPMPATVHTPAAAPPAAPVVSGAKGQMSVIKEGMFAVLRMAEEADERLTEEQLREMTREQVGSAFDAGKFNFVFKLAMNKGGLVYDGDNVVVPADDRR